MYDNGSVLILDPKTKNSFKVNGHRLKPYIGEEGLTRLNRMVVECTQLSVKTKS